MDGYIGGDTDLTERGLKYSKMLGKYIESMEHPKLKIWTSWMRRAIQTTKYVGGAQERWKALNEIDAGMCDGMKVAEIKERYPDDFVARDVNKFSYRYPRGESYEDLVARLEPVIIELERQDSVVVVSHQAVIRYLQLVLPYLCRYIVANTGFFVFLCRCLLGYYLETPEEDLPWLEVPLHTVIKLEPIAYGCKVQFIKFPVDCASTHRKKPNRPGYLHPR